MDGYNHSPGRRTFLKYSSTGIASVGVGLSSVRRGAGESSDGDETELDDSGEPIDDSDERAPVTVQSLPTNPESPPDGTIEANDYEWLPDGAPETGTDHALRLTDDGGVAPEFRFSTSDDLTIDYHWRHHSGGELAYMFNDLDSESSGFRAFTNGIAGDGLYFRNVFGGSDVAYGRDVQDGSWYSVRVVLDASDETYTVYIDGEEVGRSHYNGDGWVARDLFRVMGRESGSSTTVDYDQFVMAPAAIHPGEGELSSDLLSYELDDGTGSRVANSSESAGSELPDRFEELRAGKLEMASHIADISQDIDEVSRVESTLDDLADELQAGTVEVEAANSTVERMIMGRDITELSLAGLGPVSVSSPEDPISRVGEPSDSLATDDSFTIVGKAVENITMLTASMFVALRGLKHIAAWISKISPRVGNALENIEEGINKIFNILPFAKGFLREVSVDLSGEAETEAEELDSPEDEGETLYSLIKTTFDNEYRDPAANFVMGGFEAGVEFMLDHFDSEVGIDDDEFDLEVDDTAGDRKVNVREDIIDECKAVNDELRVTGFVSAAGGYLAGGGALLTLGSWGTGAPVGTAMAIIGTFVGASFAFLGSMTAANSIFTIRNLHDDGLMEISEGV